MLGRSKENLRGPVEGAERKRDGRGTGTIGILNGGVVPVVTKNGFPFAGVGAAGGAVGTAPNENGDADINDENDEDDGPGMGAGVSSRSAQLS